MHSFKHAEEKILQTLASTVSPVFPTHVEILNIEEKCGSPRKWRKWRGVKKAGWRGGGMRNHRQSLPADSADGAAVNISAWLAVIYPRTHREEALEARLS